MFHRIAEAFRPLLLAALLMLLAGDAHAENRQLPSADRQQALTPEQQARAHERAERRQRWHALPPAERAALRERLRQLTPEQRQRLHARREALQALPPEQRQALRERFKKLRQLPREQRRAARECLKTRPVSEAEACLPP